MSIFIGLLPFFFSRSSMIWSYLSGGSLRKARHRIRIFTDIGLAHLHPLVLRWIPGSQRRIRHGLLRRRTDAQSATQARTVFLGRRASLSQHSHASLHVETRGHSISA